MRLLQRFGVNTTTSEAANKASLRTGLKWSPKASPSGCRQIFHSAGRRLATGPQRVDEFALTDDASALQVFQHLEVWQSVRSRRSAWCGRRIDKTQPRKQTPGDGQRCENARAPRRSAWPRGLPNQLRRDRLTRRTRFFARRADYYGRVSDAVAGAICESSVGFKTIRMCSASA